MDYQTRYQYTYYIKPYKVNNYEKYILRLIKNKNMSLKIFEKGKDLDIYNYFITSIRDYFFQTFNLNQKALYSMDDNLKASIVSKMPSVNFEYHFHEDIQGKCNKEDDIFFRISKIELMCFDTGICFLIIKTNIEDYNEDFSKVLDFNYKFNVVNEEYSNLKNYENIRLQTNSFENMNDLAEFIKVLTGDITNEKFYTYSYSCIDSSHWSKLEDFEESLEKDYLKYVNIKPSKFSQEVKCDKTISIGNFAKLGITNLGCGLLTSSTENFNFTKLPYDFENQYLYTLIIALYQKEYINKELEEGDKTQDIKSKHHKFINKIYKKEIARDQIGVSIYKSAQEVFEIEERFKRANEKYEMLYKEKLNEKEVKTNKLLIILLISSFTLNIINFIAIFNLMK